MNLFLPDVKGFLVLLLAASLWMPNPAQAQRRLVLVDQDGSGPADSNQMSMLALLQSAEVEVLGITIVTGNAWRDEELEHTLRMLELTGHSGIPVVPGAVFPLVRTQEETALAAQLIGKPLWLGAWGRRSTDIAPPSGSVETVKGVHGPGDSAADRRVATNGAQ